MHSNFDYSQDIEEIASTDVLGRLANLAEAQLKAEQKVLEKEKELKEAQENLRDISEKQIPELMESVGLKEYKTNTGLDISVDKKLRASIAGEREPIAIAWLEEHGHENLIKREVKIEFNRDEQTWMNKFMSDLKKRKKPLRVSQKNSVHNMTLVSFLNEELEKGVDIPLETFGAFFQKRSKIKIKK